MDNFNAGRGHHFSISATGGPHRITSVLTRCTSKFLQVILNMDVCTILSKYIKKFHFSSLVCITFAKINSNCEYYLDTPCLHLRYICHLRVCGHIPIDNHRVDLCFSQIEKIQVDFTLTEMHQGICLVLMYNLRPPQKIFQK